MLTFERLPGYSFNFEINTGTQTALYGTVGEVHPWLK